MQKTEVVNKLEALIIKATGEKFEVERPSVSSFGDYSTNAALMLAKKEGKNPRKVAEDLVNRIEKPEWVVKIEVAGAGFVNFYLNLETIKNQAEEVNFENVWTNKLAKYGQGRKVIVEYSSPNIAKPFGIGHLRSTNIGQAIYNTYRTLGWETIGDNHLGDWGTQFGKMITAVTRYQRADDRFQIGEKHKKLEDFSISDLEKLYVKFHQEAEKDEKLTDEGREWFAKLEKGDAEAREIWEKCKNISLADFDRVYEVLDVKIDFAHGEAFYEDKMKSVIDDFRKKGLTKISQGAEIVEFELMPPAMLLKSDGTTTYFTRDLATIKYRMATWNPDLIVYEVGSEQVLHFRQVFEAAEMAGYTKKEKLYHLPHGLIRWQSGKFSTRKGDTIHLEDVIEKAREEAKLVADRSVISKEMTAEEKEEMIEAVAIGAVKFTDLSSDPKKDVIFDWGKMMDIQGDSGPYLQYTYARCKSVLSKSGVIEQKDIEKMPETIKEEESELLKELGKFEEKIVEAADRFSPSVIAEYLLSVARKYNEFYAKYRIVGEAEEVWRVWLTRTTASVLNRGLGILGIRTVEKM